jgi:branched-subunit amino acid aminotransferase/4-amino-4-deoxychorismate lyase
LRGVGRDLVFEWAAQNEISAQEGQFDVELALDADEIWLVSAASGARFVASWHDERGLLNRNFSKNCELGNQFRDWWKTAPD